MSDSRGVGLGASTPLPCSYCNGAGCLRCSICKSWYCSAMCQANHWAVHRKECVPIPALEWPDGTRYHPEEESKRIELHLKESINLCTDGPSAEEVGVNMKDMLVGRVRIEDAVVRASDSEKKFVSNEVSPNPISPIGDAANDPVGKLVTEITTSVKQQTQQASVAVQSKDKSFAAIPATTAQVSAANSSPAIVTSSGSLPCAVNAENPDVKAPSTLKGQSVKSPIMRPEVPVRDVKPDAEASMKVKESAGVSSKPTEVKSIKTDQPARQVFTPTQCRDVRSKPTVDKKGTEDVKSSPAANTTANKSQSQPKEISRVSDAPNSSLKLSQNDLVYTLAYASTILPAQAPAFGQINLVTLPVEDIQSPGNFCVRLASDEAALLKVVEDMNETPPPIVAGWTVGRRETVAVYVDDLWYRGLAVKKTEAKFSIYLLDFGGSLVTVTPDKLRPLPPKFATLPAAAYQVCLEGVGPMLGNIWGEDVGTLMGEIVNSDLDYKLGVIFKGQVDGGRFLVQLKGFEDGEDIGQMLVEGGLGKAREDQLMLTDVSKPSVENFALAPAVSAPESKVGNIEKKVSDDIAVGPKIPRGSLTASTTVGVCFLDAPDKIYVCPSSSLQKFLDILGAAQEAPAGPVNPVVGTCCLAIDEECWYRGEVLKVSSDKATIFLLDYGKTVKIPVSSLRPLPRSLSTTPGLVSKVTLKGIKPQGKEWSQDEITGALLIMDVGGETQFKITDVCVEDDTTVVSLKDMDGNDVAGLMIETGLAEPQNYKKENMRFIPGTLSPGQYKLLVLSAKSPMELYLCTEEQFQYFSDSIVPNVEVAASKATKVEAVSKGDIVLACEDQVWYRGTVLKVLNNNEIEVELVDLAMVTTVSKDHLKTAGASVLKDSIVAVSCCLDSWVNEDRKSALEKWGDKMGSLLEQYSEVEVDVTGMLGNQAKVIVPKLEQKLGIKEVSRAEMLKMKLKQKK